MEVAGGNVLKLHAGDAITGTSFYTLFKGKADAELMSHACFDALEVGNHEFDDGDKGATTAPCYSPEPRSPEAPSPQTLGAIRPDLPSYNSHTYPAQASPISSATCTPCPSSSAPHRRCSVPTLSPGLTARSRRCPKSSRRYKVFRSATR